MVHTPHVAEQERLQQKPISLLRERWQDCDETTRVVLEEILEVDGMNAAVDATKAIETELAARRKLAEAQHTVAEAQLKEMDLSDACTSLPCLLC